MGIGVRGVRDKMSVYLDLKFYEVRDDWTKVGSSYEGPVFGPLDSVSFLWDKVDVGDGLSGRGLSRDGEGFQFCFDGEGCVRYDGRKYNRFEVFGESGLDEGLRERLDDYDAGLNGSLG